MEEEKRKIEKLNKMNNLIFQKDGIILNSFKPSKSKINWYCYK